MNESTNESISLGRQVLIYIPVYRCADTIVSVIRDIPEAVRKLAHVLVIDNRSEDDTAEVVRAAAQAGTLGDHLSLIQPAKNLGYSGSQKLAYSIALQNPAVKWVMMLHGDGQYPPALLADYLPFLGSAHGVVYGYRSKTAYPDKEETPLHTYAIIKSLNLLESLTTGIQRKEWHTGFVMHATRFLREVELRNLTTTPHIDGHLLFAAGALGFSAQAIPIYKRYKGLTIFEGTARVSYVFNVLRLALTFRAQKAALRAHGPQEVTSAYRILFGPAAEPGAAPAQNVVIR
jgi:glycosyltransferase involved in cell wall biosynthesis